MAPQEGDGESLDPTLAQEIAPRLMAELELAWAERDVARLTALREAAQLLDGKLSDLARRGQPGSKNAHSCAHCEDAVARCFAVALRTQDEGAQQGR
jgi:hypothetical protein